MIGIQTIVSCVKTWVAAYSIRLKVLFSISVILVAFLIGWKLNDVFDKASQVDATNQVIIDLGNDKAKEIRKNQLYVEHLEAFQTENQKLKKELKNVRKNYKGTGCVIPVDGLRSINEFNKATQ